MRELKDYKQEELVTLYKRMNVYSTTWWFRHYKKFNSRYLEYIQKHNVNNAPIILLEYYEWKELNPKYDIADWHANYARLFFPMKKSTVSLKIQDIHDKIERGAATKADRNELKKLTYEKESLEIVLKCIYWFAGGYDNYCKNWENYVNVSTPEEVMENLHMNDKFHKSNGVATDYEMYKFVWDTLQWLSVDDLTKLLKFAENGLINKWEVIKSTRGRKSREVEILQIDYESGEVFKTYKTRNEVIENTGISKPHLSQCISTAKNSRDMNSWKKWKNEEGTVYVFYENPVN